MITARFPGVCDGCDGQIDVGDDIVSCGVDHHGSTCWGHAACIADSTPPKARPVCDECWLEQPCGCDA